MSVKEGSNTLFWAKYILKKRRIGRMINFFFGIMTCLGVLMQHHAIQNQPNYCFTIDTSHNVENIRQE
jgi:hypothetical protein